MNTLLEQNLFLCRGLTEQFQFGKMKMLWWQMVVMVAQVKRESPEDMDWILSGVGGHWRQSLWPMAPGLLS